MASSPTVLPAEDFSPVDDAKTLKEAFRGFGCDDKAIYDIIARRSNEQRQIIAQQYKTMYGKDLISKIKGELSGDFQDLIVALMADPTEFAAKQLYKAISGAGTDERTIIEVLALYSNDDIKTITEVYEELYGNSFESDIKGDTSGTVKRLFVSLSVGGRDESEEIDEEAAAQDAVMLLRAGELFVGTDESAFNEVLCQRNRSQLRVIFDKYEETTGHSFEEAIESEFSGTAKNVLKSLVHCIRDPVDFLAKRLYKSMEGIGTDDKTLIRIIVSRSEIDLGEIKAVFEEKYEKSLEDWIRSDCGGSYKKCLLTIID